MEQPNFRVEADGQLVVVSDPGTGAIRLSRALLEPWTGSSLGFQTTYERASKPPIPPEALLSSLPDLLGHIAERLENGLTEAWLSALAYGAVGTLSSQKPEEWWGAFGMLWNEPEEQWARAFTEHVVLTAYAGTGPIYYSGAGSVAGTNRMAYEAVEQGAVMPIVFACENLSTVCAMSRGATLKALGLGLECARATVETSAFGSHVGFNRGTHTTLDAVLTDTGPLTPGSVLVFNYLESEMSQTKTQASGDVALGVKHVAAVLRGDGNRVQFIDTGVLKGDDAAAGTEGGTADHEFTTRIAGVDLPHGNDLVGVGIMPPGQDLGERAGQLGAYRAWGVVRMVIIEPNERGKHTVRFVSKLLHMRYPVSRLIWSLRGLPIDGLAVLWYVFAPHDTGASESLRKSGDGRPFADVFDVKPTLYLANVIRGDATGAVTVYRYKDAGSLGTGWFQNLGGSALPRSAFEAGAAVNARVNIGNALMKKGVAATAKSFCQEQATFDLCYYLDTDGPYMNSDDVGVSYFDVFDPPIGLSSW